MVYVPQDYRVIQEIHLKFDDEVVQLLNQMEQYDTDDSNSYEEMLSLEYQRLQEESISKLYHQLEEGVAFSQLMEDTKPAAAIPLIMSARTPPVFPRRISRRRCPSPGRGRHTIPPFSKAGVIRFSTGRTAWRQGRSRWKRCTTCWSSSCWRRTGIRPGPISRASGGRRLWWRFLRTGWATDLGRGKMKKTGIFFDFDGTLFYGTTDINYYSINLALQDMNRPPISREEANTTVGDRLEDACRRILHSDDQDLCARLLQGIIDHSPEAIRRYAAVEPDCVHMLQTLSRQVPLAICSNAEPGYCLLYTSDAADE